MAKKPNPSSNVPLTKQAAGAVTGAVAGSIIAGPAGAIVGGLAGAAMGHRVEQGKPAVPTEAVAAAKSAAKQVGRVPVGKAVRSLSAKAGVLKKTTKKNAAKKTSQRLPPRKPQRENQRRRSHCQDRPRSPGPQKVGPPIINCFAGHLHPPNQGGRLPRAGKNQRSPRELGKPKLRSAGNVRKLLPV